MKCSHCGTPKASFPWTLQACADNRRKRKPRLCKPCDVALNLLVLRFFNDAAAADKVARYANA